MARTKETRANAAPGAGMIFALRAIGLVLLTRWLFSMAQMDLGASLSAMVSSPWACINLVFLFLLIFLPGARAVADHYRRATLCDRPLCGCARSGHTHGGRLGRASQGGAVRRPRIVRALGGGPGHERTVGACSGGGVRCCRRGGWRCGAARFGRRACAGTRRLRPTSENRIAVGFAGCGGPQSANRVPRRTDNRGRSGRRASARYIVAASLKLSLRSVSYNTRAKQTS